MKQIGRDKKLLAKKLTTWLKLMRLMLKLRLLNLELQLVPMKKSIVMAPSSKMRMIKTSSGNSKLR